MYASYYAQLSTKKLIMPTENTSLKSKIAGATAYNNFFIHMNSVIETHNGFTGWTEAEHQAGLVIAETTRSSAFVDTINWAWNETSIDPLTRLIRTWREIAGGIGGSLK